MPKSNKKQLAMIALILDDEEENSNNKQRRRTWVREMFMKRKKFRDYHTLLNRIYSMI